MTTCILYLRRVVAKKHQCETPEKSSNLTESKTESPNQQSRETCPRNAYPTFPRGFKFPYHQLPIEKLALEETGLATLFPHIDTIAPSGIFDYCPVL